MTTLAAVHAVLPPHRFAQTDLTAAFAEVCLGPNANHDLVARLHANTKVESRYLALPLEQYVAMRDFGEANDAFLTHAVELGTRAVQGALDDAGIRADEVDLIMSTTVTGVAVPSIEARIAHRIGLRPDVRRVPLFGLGCVAGAAGIARVHDFLLGRPRGVAVLLSVELCSLTVQRGDRSVPNLVASGLFGDGAAAVVALGSERAASGRAASDPAASDPAGSDRAGSGRAATGPRVIDSRSHLYPDTERTMGWDVGPTGLKIVLDAEVPGLVRKYLGDDIREFLHDHDLKVEDVAAWVSHPGGPKVIEAIESELSLPEHALEMTWRSLARVGNLSSSSVLHVLADTLAQRPPPPGTPGLLLAMGPGFCSELVLLEW